MEVDESQGIFQPSEYSTDIEIAASSIPGTSSGSANSSSSSSIAGSSGINLPKRTRKNNTNEELLEMAKEEHEMFKDFVEHAKRSADEKNALLRQNLEIQQKFLEYFTSK